LTELDKRQAQLLVARLSFASPDGTFSSPYGRAFESSRLHCDGVGIVMKTDPDLAERWLMPVDQYLPFNDLMHHLKLSFQEWA
ncbi:MAG: histidine phosphatase family protein, partial [Paracoccaceae bacterium]|nr:histidine phosphatase family protein [Paracoccaceae bacterium]